MPAQKPKRGRRSFLVRKKNFERKHQASEREKRLLGELAGVPEHSTNKENEPPQVCSNKQSQSSSGVVPLAPRDSSTTQSQNRQCQEDETAPERSLVGGCSRDHPNSEFEALRDDLKRSALPQNWQAFVNSGRSLQVSCIESRMPQEPRILYTVTIYADMSWEVLMQGKVVPRSCRVLQQLPMYQKDLTSVIGVMKVLNGAKVCEGNSDESFVTLCEQRGNKIKSISGDVSAYIDTEPLRTVRHSQCELLCSSTQRCQFCQRYRSTLRSLKCKAALAAQSSDQRTAHDSRTNICHLNEEEVIKRLQNTQTAKKNAQQNVHRLKAKLQKLIERDGIALNEKDANDINDLCKNLRGELKSKFGEGSFLRVLWEQQMQYHRCKDKCGIRWHPLIIRFALNLKYLSSNAYKAVKGFISLPSERTLRDYTHWTEFKAGSSAAVMERLKQDMKYGDLTPSQNKMALSLDEMKIRKGLVFNNHTGLLSGFVDLGKVNQELECLATSIGTTDSVPPTELKPAEQMLVLMVRPVFKPSFSFPVAQYPSANLKGEKIYPIVWETIESLELHGFHVVSITSDGAAPNRRFYRLCNLEEVTTDVVYKTKNPFRRGQYIFFFCDVPHLLKTARNCLSNSFAHSNSRKMMSRATKREISTF